MGKVGGDEKPIIKVGKIVMGKGGCDENPMIKVGEK